MAKKASKHRAAQRPKSRRGLIRVPRVDRNGVTVARWIRQIPSAKDLKNMPPARVEADPTAPRNPFGTVTALSSRTVDEQQEWAGQAGRAGADVLVDHLRTTDPTFANRPWRGVHHDDMVRLGAETLDFVVSVEKEEGFEFEPFMVRRFAEEASVFGTHYALARIGHPAAFSAYLDDPEMRAALIRKAQLAIPPHIHVDEDGFVRLFPHESEAGE